MASASREEVKVVLIDTQYIVTDPLSFKSVVQNLTGKDSCVSWIEESFIAGEKRKREAGYNEGKNSGSGGGGAVDGSGELSNGLSFKDLDWMKLELPPMEDWHQLLAQNNLL